jgi:hypothetical protein
MVGENLCKEERFSEGGLGVERVKYFGVREFSGRGGESFLSKVNVLELGRREMVGEAEIV